jgi:predicted PurR-regulated permease PerM
MEIQRTIPFYARVALISVGLFAFVCTLYIAQQIIVPLLYAVLIAILLNPLVNFLTEKKCNKVIAILFAVLLAAALLLLLCYVISSQLTMFSETYPRLKEKFNQASYDLVKWASDKFNIRQYKITAWVNENQADVIDNIAIGKIVAGTGRVLFVAMLLPVYVYMILYYKTLLLEFIRRLFLTEHHAAVAVVLVSTKTIVQSYLVGLFFEMLIIAVLNSGGLLLLGIDYAIILGITGAILNIIPYVGGLMAIALPMTIAFVTKDSATYPLLVLCMYICIQFIDNHFIIPKVVAKRVQINALVSIIVVLVGGALWGLPGVFLSIPLTAIIKVIFDHIEPLKAWGFLLGNIVPTASNFSFIKLVKSKPPIKQAT